MHFKISANTRKEGHTFPQLNQKRNISKEEQKALATPCLAASPSPSAAVPAARTALTRGLAQRLSLHPCSLCQAACPSPFEIPSPQMSQARIGTAPREAHAGFILAPCGPQHFADASHGTVTLIRSRPAPPRPVPCPSVP